MAFFPDGNRTIGRIEVECGLCRRRPDPQRRVICVVDLYDTDVVATPARRVRDRTKGRRKTRLGYDAASRTTYGVHITRVDEQLAGMGSSVLFNCECGLKGGLKNRVVRRFAEQTDFTNARTRRAAFGTDRRLELLDE